MFKKFFELMARKIFKRKPPKPSEDALTDFRKFERRTRRKSQENKVKELGSKTEKTLKEQDKWAADMKKRLPQSLKDRLKSGKKLTDKELSELYGQSPKEFVQQNLDRGRRQRKSVKKYRADLDKGAGKWSPSRGISPDDPGVHNSPETLRKHLMNTPGASLVGAGPAASLTRKKKRKK